MSLIFAEISPYLAQRCDELMPSQGNILLVEDDQPLAEMYTELLTLQGYAVFPFSSAPAALQFITESHKHIDLVITDMRLSDDHNKLDRSGLMLARSLDPHLCKLIISAYAGLFNSSEAPDNTYFFNKERGSEEFLEEVRHIFRQRIRLNRELEIETGDTNLSKLLRQIKGFRDLPDDALAEHLTEFERLFQRLFLRESKIKLAQLSPGQGGSGVVRTRPYYRMKNNHSYHMGAELVVKFGLRDSVVRELANYREYVETFTAMQTTDVIGELVQTRHLAAIKFRFLGTSHNAMRDFTSIFADARITPAELVEIIDHLFNDSCALWYANKYPWDSVYDLSLWDSYDQQLGLSQPAEQESLQATLQYLTKSTHTLFPIRRLSPHTLQLGEEQLPDPLYFLAHHRHLFPPSSFSCITHGDLNSRNIFVDPNYDTWLIDFYRTGISTALRDVVQLESVVKFNLLTEVSLLELIQFEECLLAPQTFAENLHLPDQWSHPQLTRAMAVIKALRHTAEGICEQSSMLEYYAGLLCQATRMLSRGGSYSPGRVATRQRHALYSAAKLCDTFLATQSTSLSLSNSF